MCVLGTGHWIPGTGHGTGCHFEAGDRRRPLQIVEPVVKIAGEHGLCSAVVPNKLDHAACVLRWDRHLHGAKPVEKTVAQVEREGVQTLVRKLRHCVVQADDSDGGTAALCVQRRRRRQERGGGGLKLKTGKSQKLDRTDGENCILRGWCHYACIGLANKKTCSVFERGGLPPSRAEDSCGSGGQAWKGEGAR